MSVDGQPQEDRGKAAWDAMEVLRSKDMEPTPKNYTLWYAYCLGNDTDLMAEMDKATTSDGVLPDTAAEELFNKYFGDEYLEAQRVELEDTNTKLANTIQKVLSLVGAAGQGARAYGSSLEDFGQSLDTDDPEQLSAALETILSATEKMSELNQELENKLQNTSAEVHELRRSLDEVKREARSDSLTGLMNRRTFDYQLDRALSDAESDGQPVSLVMFDIDHFKSFNDKFGHLLGDQVIRAVALATQACVQNSGTCARYGGEEFAVILPKITVREAKILAEDMRVAVEQKSVKNKRTNESLGNITISLGVAEHILGEDAPALIERADQALYKAKAAGRNCVITQAEL